MFAGLAFDVGTIFVAKREALNVATAAARKGAADVTESSLYQGRPELAPSAGATAMNFASGQGYRAFGGIYGAERDRVVVRVEATVTTSFLTIVGISTITVDETAVAQVQTFALDGP